MQRLHANWKQVGDTNFIPVHTHMQCHTTPQGHLGDLIAYGLTIKIQWHPWSIDQFHPPAFCTYLNSDNYTNHLFQLHYIDFVSSARRGCDKFNIIHDMHGIDRDNMPTGPNRRAALFGDLTWGRWVLVRWSKHFQEGSNKLHLGFLIDRQEQGDMHKERFDSVVFCKPKRMIVYKVANEPTSIIGRHYIIPHLW